MGDLQIKKNGKQYDAVIVGSGAGGGMAAYVLAKAGLKVCLLEAGPMYDPKTDSNQLKNPWDSPRRGASTKFRPYGDLALKILNAEALMALVMTGQSATKM